MAGGGQGYKPTKPATSGTIWTISGTIYKYCEYEGHFMRNCYTLVGCSPDFQMKKHMVASGEKTKPYANYVVLGYSKGRYLRDDLY